MNPALMVRDYTWSACHTQLRASPRDSQQNLTQGKGVVNMLLCKATVVMEMVRVTRHHPQLLKVEGLRNRMRKVL